jgi:DNA repair protein RecO (recombination protein O)
MQRDRGEILEQFEAEGICLRAVDFGENDKILTLYMAQKGKVAVKARGCKSAKSKLKYAATPMCFGKYYIVGKGNLLAGCDLIDSFFNIAYDAVKYYCACAILEVVDKMTLEDDYNHALFVEALSALNELCYSADYPKVCLFQHLGKIAAALGYEVKAITLKDYYNYFYHTHSVKINSLRQLIKLDEFK